MLLATPQKLSKVKLPLPLIYYKGERIEMVSEFRLLGVTIDSNLSFKTHVNNLCKQLSSALFPIIQAKKLRLPIHIRTLLYHAFFHSRILYCLPAHSSCSDSTLLHKIRVLQNAALRIIFDAKPRESSAPLFKRANILPFENLITESLILHMHSICSNPDYPDYFSAPEAPTHSHYTRHAASGAFIVPPARTATLSRSVTHRMIRAWNSVALPLLPQSSSNRIIKTCLKKSFIDDL